MRRVWILLALAVGAVALWGGYWALGARAYLAAVDRALSDQNPQAPVRAAGRSLAGFPNRFDLTLFSPRLAFGGIEWTGAFLQVFALSYRPHHVIVVFPREHFLRLNGQTWGVSTADARASLVAEPSLRLPLERAVLVFRAPKVLDPAGRLFAEATNARAGLRRLEPLRYDLAVEISTLELAFLSVLPRPAAGGSANPAPLDPAADLAAWPRILELVRLEGDVVLDRPLDRTVLLERPPEFTLVVKEMRVHAGAFDFALSGTLVVDGKAPPAGTLTLSLSPWPEILRLLLDVGVLRPDGFRILDRLARELADRDAPERLSLPIRVEAGRVKLGPIVLFALEPR